MKSALITGVTGFAGRHLAELLVKKGVKVSGTFRSRSNISGLRELGVDLVECDLRDAHSTQNVFRGYIEPPFEVVFHLAADTFVPASFTAPCETFNTNVLGTLNLLEAIRKHSDGTRIVNAGSSEQYGLVHENELPITEETPFRPLSPYAVSKIAQEDVCKQYARSYGLDVVLARSFNYLGPGGNDRTVVPAFCKQIAEVESGKRDVVLHGNLSARRDFVDVRDAVRAYFLLATQASNEDVFNICTGNAVSMEDLLGQLLSLSPDPNVEAEVDVSRMRPSDVPVLKGSFHKLRAATGWMPTYRLTQSLEDTLNYWRQQVNPHAVCEEEKFQAKVESWGPDA